MEFKQITIQNFLSYYIKSTFDFESTTIILGQNNTGKSKLFDAINFVLYERVYELMRRPFDHSDKEGVVRLLQDISDTATEVADKMRLCLSKQRVISMVCCDEWIYEPIQHMMRTLMNNLTYLRQ